MRYLIDGYNLMYAGGLLGKPQGPKRFRTVRTRFLNDLAEALGPLDARQTTVVFDAAGAPADVPHSTPHKGLTVVYAVDDESADDRIERLIAAHSVPKSLTVVSSDRRIRTAATRRRAQAVTAEAFWEQLDARKRLRFRPPVAEPPAPPPPAPVPLPEEESRFWQREFADLDRSPETREALNAEGAYLTDEEIAEIERQVERESD